MSFIDAFNDLYSNFGSGNDNETEEREPCVTKIDHQAFHIWLLIPSVCMILLLAFTISRKHRALDCFYGRPGAVFPMDILGKSHRFSYAAAWGTVAFLASDMVTEQKFALKLEGAPIITALNAVLSMIIYGIDYFPLFAGLALESVTGYLVGTAYAWMHFGINIYKETECDYTYQARLILILRDLPQFLCLGYLSISLPVRTVQALRGRTAKLISSSEMVSILNTTKDMGKTPEGIHVYDLFKPEPPPPPPPTGFSEKIKKLLKDLFNEWIYRRQSSFRYSARIISVAFLGLLLLYKLTLEIMVTVLSIFTLVERGFQATLDFIGWLPEPDEESEIAAARDGVFVMYYLLIAGRACFITAISVACFTGLVAILNTLTTYRNNCFNLYKGNCEHIPHRDTRSPTSLLVGAMKFAGYQVGYIAWGFLIHFLILLIVALAIATVITFIKEGFYQWILTILANAWPAAVLTIAIMLLQLFAAKLFLQGDDLALDNRRFLFTFTFFMFFYNIFVGLVSCLMRIIKSIVIGAIFLPRLDHSALPRRFQMLDPGFAAYVGFIHVECAHTHPVLVVFLRLLLVDQVARQSTSDPRDTTTVTMNEKDTSDPKKKYIFDKPRVSSKARNKWFLLYTLYNNPTLRSERKQYINYVKALRDRIARHYNMNTSAKGALVKGTNKSMTQLGTTVGGDNQSSGSEVKTGPSKAQMNWNAMLGMSRFMRAAGQGGRNQQMAGAAIDMEVAMLEMSNAMIDEEEAMTGVATQPSAPALQTHLINTKPSLWKRAAFTALTKGDSVEMKSTDEKKGNNESTSL